MAAGLITPPPFFMTKKKQYNQRNFVAKGMLENPRKAGYHVNPEKEHDKYLCREKIDIEDYLEDEDDFDDDLY